MTGGQALAQQLLRHGIDTIFGLPGIQLDFVSDAPWEERDRIRMIHTRHEQAKNLSRGGCPSAASSLGRLYNRSRGRMGLGIECWASA